MTVSINGTSGLVFNDGSTQGTGGYTGFRNRIINGAMMIDQRNAGASVTIPFGGAYITDRWAIAVSQGSKLTAQQNAASVTPPAGFKNYLGITTASAYAVTSNDYFQLSQPIEGLNVADLGWGTANASTITLSFWVRSSLIGIFGGSLKNSAANRSYAFSYVINSANTWEQKTITVTGDTSGTWLTDNGVGLNLVFGLGMGSSFSGTAGSWAATNYGSATGATSIVGTSGATFYITGVQLEKGLTATSFDYRPYGTELALCQRYYYKVPGATAARSGSFYASSTTAAIALVPFPVTMRTAPSGFEQSGTASDYTLAVAGGSLVCSAVPTGSGTANTGVINLTVASGLTNNWAGQIRAANEKGFLAWSAEL
jgi:hypothetical protein